MTLTITLSGQVELFACHLLGKSWLCHQYNLLQNLVEICVIVLVCTTCLGIMQNIHKTAIRLKSFEHYVQLTPNHVQSDPSCALPVLGDYISIIRVVRSDYWRCRQFACMTVLLGLTAYRVHYTKTLDQPDVLTTRTHYYGAYSDFCNFKILSNIRFQILGSWGSWLPA